MSATHTPEPWELVEREDESLFFTRGGPGRGHEAFDFCGQKSTALRFLACVNALEGIENPRAVKELLAVVGLIHFPCICHLSMPTPCIGCRLKAVLAKLEGR